MPVIPTSDSFTRQTPNLRTGVSTPDYTPLAQADLAVGKGYEEAGKGMLILDAAIKKKKLADDTFDYTIARSQYLQKTIELEDQLRNEPDFTKIPQIKQERMNQIRSETSSMVSNPKLSAQLNSEMDLQGVKSNIEFDGIYRAKRNDADRATTQEEIGTIEQAIASTTNEKFKAELITTRNQLVASAEYRGAIDKESASKIIQDSSERIAINEISALPESQQIAALGARKEKNGTITFAKTNTFADNLPVAKKLALYDRAEQGMKQKQDDYISQIKKNDYLRERKAKEDALNIVLNGGTVDQIPLEQYALLNDTEKANLNKTRQIKNGTYQVDPVKSDEAYFTYRDIYQASPQEFANVDRSEIMASITPGAKLNQILGLHQKAQAGENMPVTLAKQNEIANQTLNSIGIGPNNKESAKFKTRFNEEIEYYKSVNGKDPLGKDLREMANGLVVKASFEGLFGDSNKMLYKVKREDIMSDVVVPDDFTNKITMQNKQAGRKELTEDQIRNAYLMKLKNAR